MALVEAVHASPKHAVQKATRADIRLVEGIGVEGDVHAGATVQHRSRVGRGAPPPNLRQVHLIPCELFEELHTEGFTVAPGQMGENITTSGIDLITLPAATRLRLGHDAVVEITGLRNPCEQLNGIQQGLMAAVLGRDDDGALVRRAGVMAIVVAGGAVRGGDPIAIELPSAPHVALQPV